MARQYADARASYDAARADAPPIARRIAETGRLVMLGMGASHWANRIVVARYRALGIDAVAEVLSENMRMPIPGTGHVTLVVSQSGESGEVLAWLRGGRAQADRFGLTLDAGSALARGLPGLTGRGPKEAAFAATRSIVVTLALHAAILAELGHEDDEFLDVLDNEPPVPAAVDPAAVAALASCDQLVLSSRGEAHCVLEAAALTYMELARAPALALELGQLLHGPIECLSPRTALVMARPAGDDGGVTALARAAVSYGLAPILFDLGDHPAVEGCVRVRLAQLRGLAGSLVLLPAVQSIAIEAAGRRVPDAGTPLRARKITDGEAP
jgi:fructoselysine-6-P-deglycase FrlB-like protein